VDTMTDFDVMLAKTPEDRHTVLVFADWLIEFRDLTRFAALRRATQHRRATLQARELAKATSLIQVGSVFRKALIEAVEESWSGEGAVSFLPRLVTGSRPPTWVTRKLDALDQSYPYAVAIIGARWVINQCRHHLTPAAPGETPVFRGFGRRKK